MKKLHYSWVICILGMLMIFVTTGMVSNGFSIFLPYIRELRGFTNTQTSFLINVRYMVAFASMLSIGVYYKLLGMRLGTGLAVIFAGVAFFLYGIADSYGLFCVAAAVSGLGYGMGSMIPVSILMNRWFTTRQALAIGICAAGSGFATVIIPPINTLLVETMSMKAAFLIDSVGILIIGLFVCVFMRNQPGDKGLRPFGQKQTAAGRKKTTAVIQEEEKLPAKLWCLVGCASLTMGVLSNPGFSHLSILYSTEGYSPYVVSLIVSSMGIVLTFGKIVYGQVTDRIGGFSSTLCFGCVLIVGHIFCCLVFLHVPAVCIAQVLTMGIGYPISTVGVSIWARDFAPRSQYPVIVKRLQIIFAGGALIFSSVPGILADLTGTYITAYVLFTVLLVIALTCITVAYRKRQKLRNQINKESEHEQASV